ncbi:OLC1v1018828C1 [Oldenlandia corymbosa var. corymbosa]|uniref:Voltage-gated hydrogen channel 1 n=1 Tax=Oldenlandia corymbosa var. corymbosa TaxID=529605 RepID=A0AAV1ECH7_OLDCO|nr:OLC1v1018828C1 [Oldenlandia corymbosa var. corymbosa]
MDSSSQIQSLEISLQSLTKSFNRRRKWKAFFDDRRAENRDEVEEQRSSWRSQLSDFLNSTEIHIFTIILLFTDIIFTSLEISSSVVPSSSSSPKQEVWFHWAGIGFMGLLCVRSLFLLIGLGWRSFLRSPGYVLDGLVMLVALILELFLENKGGGLVVVVSLWRIVRVVESAFELSDEAIEAKIELVLQQFQNLKDENASLLEIILEKDLIIEELREELSRKN